MNNLINRYRWIKVVLGVLIVLAGVGLIVLGIISPGQVNLILSIVTAVILFIIGLVYVVAGIITPLNELYSPLYFYGAFAIAIGIILLIHNELASEILIYTIAVISLTVGVIYVTRGILAIVNKMKAPIIVLFFVVGVLLIGFGVVALIFKAQILQAIYIVAGVFITVTGVLELISTVRQLKAK